eukprot:scaffold373_cov350-Pavlova_lutheri.AAC.2
MHDFERPSAASTGHTSRWRPIFPVQEGHLTVCSTGAAGKGGPSKHGSLWSQAHHGPFDGYQFPDGVGFNGSYGCGTPLVHHQPRQHHRVGVLRLGNAPEARHVSAQGDAA